MIEVARSEFDIQVDPLGQERLQQYAIGLFSRSEALAASELPFGDFVTNLTVEEGSLKGKWTALAAAGAVYTAIAQFDGFLNGMSRFAAIGRSIADRVVEAAMNDPATANADLRRSRRGAGVPARVASLHHKVRTGAMERTEAAQQIIQLLSDEDVMPAALTDQIIREIQDIRQVPKQLLLDFGETATWMEAPLRDQPNRERRLPVPQFALPPDRWRVEVWRDETNGERRVRVVHL